MIKYFLWMCFWSWLILVLPWWIAAGVTVLRLKYLGWRQDRRDKAAAILNGANSTVVERTMVVKNGTELIPLEDILDPPCAKPLEHINLKNLTITEKDAAVKVGELRRTMNARTVAKMNHAQIPELPDVDKQLLKAVEKSQITGVCKHGTYLSDLCVRCRREIAGL